MLVTVSRSTEAPVPPSHRKALNTRLASLARELTDWAAVGADLFAADPKRAPVRLSRVLNARVQSQIQPRIGLLSGLVDRPFSHAREAIPYWPQLHPARGGSTGNLLAAVDENSGRISAVYRAAPGRRFLLSTITHHPTTGARLTGQRLPMWQDALDLALRAAGEVPECPLAGADVALTEDGPRILEINAAWDGSYAELTKGVGLRRMLRLLWPELAIDDATKRKAAELLNL